MPLKPYPGTRFECTGCGACCGGWDVRVSPAQLATWDETELRSADPPLSPEPLLVRDVEAEGEPRYYLARRGYSCALLEADRRCRLQRVLGAAAKPDPCRKFPLLLVLSPAGPVVSVRPDCAEYWRTWESGPLLAQAVGELGPILRRAPLAYWPTEIRLRLGVSLPSERLGALQAGLLEAVAGEANVFEGLGAMARWLLEASPRSWPAGSPSDSDAALARGWRWLAAVLRDALRAEPFLHDPTQAGPALNAEPYLQRLLVVASQGPAATAERSRLSDAAERYLVEVLRRFVINLEFARSPDLATALGGLVASLRLVLAATPPDSPPGADLAWIGPALAFLMRTGPPSPTSQASVVALRRLMRALVG